MKLTEPQIKNLNDNKLSKFVGDICVFYESQVRKDGKKCVKIQHLIDTDSKEECIIFNMEDDQ